MSARKPIPTAWWLRPVKKEARVGEHSEVTWNRLKRAPPAARASMWGVPTSDPKAPRCPKPVSSRTMTITFGAPSGLGSGGKRGVESAAVKPICCGSSMAGEGRRSTRRANVAGDAGSPPWTAAAALSRGARALHRLRSDARAPAARRAGTRGAGLGRRSGGVARRVRRRGRLGANAPAPHKGHGGDPLRVAGGGRRGHRSRGVADGTLRWHGPRGGTVGDVSGPTGAPPTHHEPGHRGDDDQRGHHDPDDGRRRAVAWRRGRSRRYPRRRSGRRRRGGRRRGGWGGRGRGRGEGHDVGGRSGQEQTCAHGGSREVISRGADGGLLLHAAGGRGEPVEDAVLADGPDEAAGDDRGAAAGWRAPQELQSRRRGGNLDGDRAGKARQEDRRPLARPPTVDVLAARR